MVFIKGYGALAGKALTEPVTITKNGRDRLVVVSAEEYERLRRRDRRAFRAEELSEVDIALIAKTEMAPEHPTSMKSLATGRRDLAGTAAWPCHSVFVSLDQGSPSRPGGERQRPAMRHRAGGRHRP